MKNINPEVPNCGCFSQTSPRNSREIPPNLYLGEKMCCKQHLCATRWCKAGRHSPNGNTVAEDTLFCIFALLILGSSFCLKRRLECLASKQRRAAGVIWCGLSTVGCKQFRRMKKGCPTAMLVPEMTRGQLLRVVEAASHLWHLDIHCQPVTHFRDVILQITNDDCCKQRMDDEINSSRIPRMTSFSTGV